MTRTKKGGYLSEKNVEGCAAAVIEP